MAEVRRPSALLLSYRVERQRPDTPARSCHPGVQWDPHKRQVLNIHCFFTERSLILY
jgi:hypothetical protein